MSARRAGQAGLSLPELMVTMIIGLVLLLGIGQIFQSGKQSYSTQTGMGALQENGRFAMYFLQRDLRRAGFPRTFGPGGSQPVVPFVAANTCDACASGFDQVEIQFNSDPDVNAPIGPGNTDADTSGDGVADNGTNQDCLGQDVPLTGSYADGTARRTAGTGAVSDVAGNTVLVRNRYYVDNDSDGTPSLFCLGGGSATPQPIVKGVESFQVLYGEDTDADSYANVYRRASDVGTWANVVAVRVGLLVNTLAPVAEDLDTQQYAVLDAAPLTAANVAGTTIDERKFRRRVFTTTVEIRNRSQ